MIAISENKRLNVWQEMKRHLNRHNKWVIENRNEKAILSEYYYCMGMLFAMRELGAMPEDILVGYEKKLYKPFEK